MIEINYSILIIQAFSFLIAVAILWKIAWKPLTEHLTNRKKSIEDDINKAKYSRENAIKLEDEYKNKIKLISKEEKEMLNKSVSESKKIKDEMIKEAQAETKNIFANAEKEILQEKENVKKELQNDIASLSTELAGKILKKSIDKKMEESLIFDFIEKLKNER